MYELNPQKYVLSLDLGSSGLKTAIISDKGDVAAYSNHTALLFCRAVV